MSSNLFLDTNSFIYHFHGDIDLSNFIKDYDYVYYSFITRIELLSFHNISDEEEREANRLLNCFIFTSIDEEIMKDTILFRKNYKLKVPDSIIIASAKKHSADLLTNDQDLKNKVSEINIINPFINL